MKRSLYSILIFSFALLSCRIITPEDNISELCGYWINPEHQDSLITYSNASFLTDNEYGFAFLEDNVFLERKNSGWCGTPPISYSDYEGTWSISDSLITIEVSYWGGIATYHWKLISATRNELKIVPIYES